MRDSFDCELQCEDFWGEELMFKPDIDLDSMEAEEEAHAAAEAEKTKPNVIYDIHEYLEFVFGTD